MPPTRLPFERRVYRVSASVTLVRQEEDDDLHLVLRSGSAHMIAEDAPVNGPHSPARAAAFDESQSAVLERRYGGPGPWRHV